MQQSTGNYTGNTISKEPLISVIIPVYNLEQYIDSCLESVTAQTYNNLEILVVNDGSTDGSGEKCEEWAAKDSRILCIHKENGGAAAARNAALRVYKGELLLFVDGDDSLDKDYVRVLYHHLTAQAADISICGWVNRREEETVKAVRREKECSSYDRTEALKKLMYQEDYDTAMWCKLYRRELFQDLFFTDGNIYEDIDLIYKVFERTAKVVYTPYAGYFYLLRESGTTLKTFSRKKMDLIDVVEEMRDYLVSRYPELEQAVASKFVRANFHIYLQIPAGREFGPERKRMEANIRRYRSTVLKDSRARRGTKMALVISGISFPLFAKLKKLKAMGK